MATTVLVIDSNAAVQAITALALSQTGCTVEQLADGSHAYERILSLKPAVVLIAKDVAGIDPFQLAVRIREQLRGIALVLLAPGDANRAVVDRARESGFAEVLLKPFKSNRLREVVTRLLSESTGIETQGPEFLLEIGDDLLRRIVERLVAKRGALTSTRAEHAPGVEPERAAFTATIVAWTAPDPLRWYEPRTMGNLILLIPERDHGNAAMLFPAARLLHLPLSYTQFSAALDPLVPPSPLLTTELGELEQGEAVLLAARVSAAVFERLLIQPSFRSRNWEEAGQSAKEETLRVLKDVER